MPNCCAFSCTNRSNHGYKQYRIPQGRNNQERRKIWLRRISRANFNPSEAYLCEVHFESDQFERNIPGKLKPNAVPTIFSHRIYPKVWPASLQEIAPSTKCDSSVILKQKEESLNEDSKTVTLIPSATYEGVSSQFIEVYANKIAEQQFTVSDELNHVDSLTSVLTNKCRKLKKRAHLIPVTPSDVPESDKISEESLLSSKRHRTELIEESTSSISKGVKHGILQNKDCLRLIDTVNDSAPPVEKSINELINMDQFISKKSGGNNACSPKTLESYMSLNVTETCRLCLLKCAVSYDLFKEAADENNTMDNHAEILNCIPVKIDKDDDLPKQICKTCYDRLADWFRFREMCFSTDVILKQYFSNIGHPNPKMLKKSVSQKQTHSRKSGTSGQTPVIIEEHVPTVIECTTPEYDISLIEESEEPQRTTSPVIKLEEDSLSSIQDVTDIEQSACRIPEQSECEMPVTDSIVNFGLFIDSDTISSVGNGTKKRSFYTLHNETVHNDPSMKLNDSGSRNKTRELPTPSRPVDISESVLHGEKDTCFFNQTSQNATETGSGHPIRNMPQTEEREYFRISARINPNTYHKAVCCVRGCTSKKRNDPSLRFFTLPETVKAKREAWLKFADIKGPLRKVLFFCAKHFEANAFTNTSSTGRIRRYGVPTLHPPSPFEEETSQSKDSEQLIKTEIDS